MFYYESCPEVTASSQTYASMDKTQHLTEEILGNILKDIYGVVDVVPQYKIGKFKADFLIKSLNLLVEFDGFRHYSSTKVVMRDIDFYVSATDQGFDVVRVPYFLQADVVMPLYFNTHILPIHKHADVYPQGFVHANCLHPKDFCVAGLKRFVFEVDRLPTPIREDVYQTFDKDDDYVFDSIRGSDMFGEYEPYWLG